MLKFVFFDVGGVIISDLSSDISSNGGWKKMKWDMGINSDIEPEFDRFFDDFEFRVCIGRELDEIVPLLRKKFKLKLPPNYSMVDDFVSRFAENRFIWPLINEIKTKYKVGLITNMYPRMLKKLNEKGLMPEVEWDVVIDSSAEKVQKPQIEIFELAQKRSGYQGKEILFVDNSQRHLDSAKKLGWNTFLYDPTNPRESANKLSDYFLRLIK